LFNKKKKSRIDNKLHELPIINDISLKTIKLNTNKLSDAIFTSNGKYIITIDSRYGFSGNEIDIWELETGKKINTLRLGRKGKK
jgi:hypothetical protein